MLRLIWNFVYFSFTTSTNTCTLEDSYIPIIFDISRGISLYPLISQDGSLTFARPGFLGSTDLPSPHEVQIYQTLRKMKLSDEFFMKVLTASKNIVLQKSYNWLNIFSALKNWKCVFTKSVRYPYYLDSILCFPSCKYAFSVFQRGKNIHSVVTFL